MKSAKLEPEEVTRIIIVATMTPNHSNGLAETLSKRHRAGYADIGCHYFIAANGQPCNGVPDTDRGTYVSRYARTSIVILLNGGANKSGQPVNNFGLKQLVTLRRLVGKMTALYPNAKPTMYRELFRGVNPVIEHEDY